ncbi:hypothetical protein MKW92_019372 [Papaver armeniacum]|nr:hypothetical protein MKW92_019372 [Papaver armeniacum]
MDTNHQTMYSPLNVCLISEDFITPGDHFFDAFPHTYDTVKENHQDDEDALLERRKLQCHASFIKGESIFFVSETPTMILGMDVSHGSPGHSDITSVDAVVGSRSWSLVSRYRAFVHMQSPKVEMIGSLYKVLPNGEDDGIMRNEVSESQFNQVLNVKLEQIIKNMECPYSLNEKDNQSRILPLISRNGVSESQFNQVLNVKLEQIIKNMECPYSLNEEDNQSRILPLISRNGVSESQFNQVLNIELEQIIKNMESLYLLIEEDNQSRRSPPIVSVEMMFEQIKQKLPGSPGFLLCALAERKNSDVYGIVSQCICTTNINDQYLIDVLLKLNTKLGGTNSLLALERVPHIPLISETPTMILGMDVSHGSPGQSDILSIDAVLGFGCWPLILSYRPSVRTRSPEVEMSDSMYKVLPIMTWELLVHFYPTSNGRKPSQIIILRDGVSESQFNQVLNAELEQIIKGTSFHAHSNVLLNGVGFSPHDLQKLLHSLSSLSVAASIVVPCQSVPKREHKSVVAVALDGDKRGYKRPRCGWDPFFRCGDCRRIIIAKNLSVVFSEEMYGLLNVRTARVVAENVHGNLQLIGFDLACRHCRGIVGLGFLSLTFPRWDVYFLFRARVF